MCASPRLRGKTRTGFLDPRVDREAEKGTLDCTAWVHSFAFFPFRSGVGSPGLNFGNASRFTAQPGCVPMSWTARMRRRVHGERTSMAPQEVERTLIGRSQAEMASHSEAINILRATFLCPSRTK